MIKLDVCEYCQNCVEFDPCVTARPELLYVDNEPHGFIGDTIVKCKNCYKCAALYRYLERSEENEDAEN